MPDQLPFHFAKKQGVFVRQLTDEAVIIAYRPDVTAQALLECRRFLQRHLQLEPLTTEQFPVELAQAYEMQVGSAVAAMGEIEESLDLQQLMQQMPSPQDLLESADEAPIIRLINAILTQAIKKGASDIHFETYEDSLKVRYRIDGVLQEVLQPPRVLAPLLISRLKIMAKLDIAEKRLPQDGRISLRIAGRVVDVRVSTIPTHHGERIVLRLLDQQAAPLDLVRLGMANDTLHEMRDLIHKPHGIILVTGPTGSGKTTTLYAALTELNDRRRNILTIEDPIEYYLPGIGQTQVNTKVGMTFARSLRAILRQDPDIVMVGEIRDMETVEMAIQAALTGHLVLSTLHTNSAVGAITRLRDMGAESFLLSSTIIGVIAQRLVRVLCPSCREAYSANASEKLLMGVPDDENLMLYRSLGCDACAQSGYQGRTGIYEVVTIDETMRALIHDEQSEASMEKWARQQTRSIRQDGWLKVREGTTSIEEVLRVASEDV